MYSLISVFTLFYLTVTLDHNLTPNTSFFCWHILNEKNKINKPESLKTRVLDENTFDFK